MMERLMREAELRAVTFTRDELLLIASDLGRFFGEETTRVEEDQVVVRGRGVMTRWLNDAMVRFAGRSRR